MMECAPAVVLEVAVPPAAHTMPLAHPMHGAHPLFSAWEAALPHREATATPLAQDLGQGS